jgi:short-subunit dehydrogenase
LRLEDRWRIRVSPIAADLGDPLAGSHIASALADLGLRIDVLVNNAGYAQPGSYLDNTWEDQHRYLQVLAVSSAELTRRLLPGMVERGWGRVINVSSIGGLLAGAPGQALYAASKAFLVKLSESVAAEYERYGVRSTVAMLGPTRTEFNEVAGLTSYFDEHPMMGLWTMAPEPVVRKVYEASARGRRVVVPGTANRVAAALFVHTPPGVRYALGRLTADAGQPGASPLPDGADLPSAEAKR